MNIEKMRKLLSVYGNQNSLEVNLGDPVNVRCRITNAGINAKMPTCFVLEADFSGSNNDRKSDNLYVEKLMQVIEYVNPKTEVFIAVVGAQTPILFTTDTLVMNGNHVEFVAKLHPLEDPEIVKKVLGTYTFNFKHRTKKSPYYLVLQIPDGVDVIGFSNQEERDVSFEMAKELFTQSNVKILKGSVVGIEI